MGSISSWVLSIAGIVCISVIIEIIMPEGQMNKYIRGVLSFIIILVIISPLPNLLKAKDININPTINQIGIQQEFIDNFNIAKKDAYELDLSKLMESIGYGDVSFELNLKTDGEKYYFDKLFVDLSKLVIKENAQHKDIVEIKEEILGEVSKVIKDVEVYFEE